MKRKIPSMNYVLLALICLVTVVLVFLLANWYTESKKQGNRILKGFLSSINKEEIDNYIMENPDSVIYLIKEETKVDERIKKLISDNDIKNRIVLIDCSVNCEDINNYLKIDTNIPVPNLIYYEDGMIKDIMYDQYEEVSYQEFYRLLIRNKVIGND